MVSVPIAREFVVCATSPTVLKFYTSPFDMVWGHILIRILSLSNILGPLIFEAHLTMLGLLFQTLTDNFDMV